jgi:hypothetical protein
MGKSLQITVFQIVFMRGRKDLEKLNTGMSIRPKFYIPHYYVHLFTMQTHCCIACHARDSTLNNCKVFFSLSHSLTELTLLETPPIVQLLKNFPAFYGTQRFITVFTRALVPILRIIFLWVSLNIQNIKKCFQTKVLDLNEIYTAFHTPFFCMMYHL